jgi:hypothetical protein
MTIPRIQPTRLLRRALSAHLPRGHNLRRFIWAKTAKESIESLCDFFNAAEEIS